MSDSGRPRAETRVATPGTFDVFSADQFPAKVKFVGGNSVGPQVTMELLNVLLRPANPVAFIGDAWGELHLTGEVLADETGSFGTLTHPDTTIVSPVVGAYYLGKGIVSIQTATDISYRDVGNVPTFEFVPAVTTLPHYSSRHGVRIKDLEIIHEKAATLNMIMDEFTYENLKLVLMGVDTGGLAAAARQPERV
jgi:hypothetical protein